MGITPQSGKNDDCRRYLGERVGWRMRAELLRDAARPTQVPDVEALINDPPNITSAELHEGQYLG
jgi:hypothetical protein